MRDGIDPIEARKKQRAIKTRVTLEEAINRCFVARQAELKNDGKSGRWMSPLKLHVIPKIGDVAIEDLDQHQIIRAIEPIWHSKADTARKSMNRINLTLKHAAAMGLEVDLQATMKARALLGKQRHMVRHIPSMPYKEVPAFYKRLCSLELGSAVALRMLILTLARTSEVRFCKFDDIVDDVWIIPESLTKSGTEHRIPLVSEVQEIIFKQKALATGEYIFASPTGRSMSDAAMSRFMEREGYKERPHGFRASFRTWVEEQTNTPFEVKEAALGHAVDGEVVRAYQRSDRLEKRRNLLELWTRYLST